MGIAKEQRIRDTRWESNSEKPGINPPSSSKIPVTAVRDPNEKR